MLPRLIAAPIRLPVIPTTMFIINHYARPVNRRGKKVVFFSPLRYNHQEVFGMNDFGYRVRAARAAAGLTQLELAQAMGYSTRSTISRIESGDNQIPMDKLDALARALHTTSAYLLGQEEPRLPAAPAEPAQAEDPFLREFWQCALRLRRDQQEMLLRLMRELAEKDK